jgi:hypothetical protein
VASRFFKFTQHLFVKTVLRAPHFFDKHKHWRGVQGIYACKATPVLEFQYLFFGHEAE